jgi:imidazolonepropionase-like amidohydrolase
LLDAGIPFCISGSDRSETWNARILPYHAATAVAYGLPADEALKSITLSPAEILGVADRVGSLDPGKDATLIVTDGDPLETTTHVTLAFVQGRAVDLTNKQTRLYDKYREKYRRLNSGAQATR